MIEKFDTAIVIGAGAFGTSLASVLSNNFKQVILKVRSPDLYEMLKRGTNPTYLPGIKLASNIHPAINWEEIYELSSNGSKVELIVIGLPSHALNTLTTPYHANNLKLFLEKDIPIVCLTKGINPETLRLPDDILFDFFPEYEHLIHFLSGPSYAEEILEEQITHISLAGKSRKNLLRVSEMLQTGYFKPFPTYDIKGVLLGGALKNVLAIAAGVLEGYGLNHNSRAALITAGISDMLHFGVVFNARPETFYGLSGMGDLILTTTGNLSRNKWFGKELAKGRSPLEILESQKSVIEGYQTSKACKLMAEQFHLHCPIFNSVYQVLYQNRGPKEIVDELTNYYSKSHSIF